LPARAQYDPRWRDIHAIDLDKHWLEIFKKVLIEARDVKAQITYAVFNDKPPEQAVLDKRTANIRGKPATVASTFDKSQDRRVRSLTKHGVESFTDVMDRIQRDAGYRRFLANYLINVDCYYNPAQYLLSRYCRAAFACRRGNGEIEPAQPPAPVTLPEFTDTWYPA